MTTCNGRTRQADVFAWAHVTPSVPAREQTHFRLSAAPLVGKQRVPLLFHCRPTSTYLEFQSPKSLKNWFIIIFLCEFGTNSVGGCVC